MAHKGEAQVQTRRIRRARSADDLNARREQAFEVFARWLRRNNPEAWVGTMDDWNVGPYEHKDIFVISPSGRRRSNRQYLIKGEACLGFSPSNVNAEVALDELVELWRSMSVSSRA